MNDKISTIADVLDMAKAQQATSWGRLGLKLDQMIGKDSADLSTYAAYGRIVLWRRHGVVPRKYIKALASLAGIPEDDVRAANARGAAARAINTQMKG